MSNQRETAVVLDRTNGKPFYNAVVWQCTRTDAICRELEADGGKDRFRASTGLPITTYFSGPKIRMSQRDAAASRNHFDRESLG